MDDGIRSPLTAKLNVESQKAVIVPRFNATAREKDCSQERASAGIQRTIPDRIPAKAGSNLTRLFGFERSNKIMLS
jgi:hypothetical protein